MATPRYKLIDEDNAACYHVTSRCVHNAWLCGFDRRTRGCRGTSCIGFGLKPHLSHSFKLSTDLHFIV